MSGNLLVPIWTVRLPAVTSGGTTFNPAITASAAIATVDVSGTPRLITYVVSQNSHVYAFDAATGNQVWEVSVGDGVESTPLIKDNVVYLVTNNGNLTALAAATGASLWVRNSGGWQDRSSPNFSGGNIICATAYPRKIIYAVPIGSGNPAPEAWHVATGQYIYSSPSVDPVTQNIYCGSDDGKVYAIKPNGSPLWTQPFATAGGIFRASPCLGNGKVYITGGDYDWMLHAIDASTGALVWDAPMRPTPDPDTLPIAVYKGAKVSSAAVDGSFVAIAGGYCGTLGGSDLYAYRDNGASGQLLWKAALPNKGQDFLSSPVVTPTSVLVGVAGVPDPLHANYPTGRLYVADRATGATVWYASGSASHAGGPILASPAVAGDLVVVGDTSGLVTTYEAVPCGDVDGDGVVSALDAVSLMAGAGGDGAAPPYQMQRADVYPANNVPADGLRSFGDGKITPGDANRLLGYAIGLEPTMP